MKKTNSYKSIHCQFVVIVFITGWKVKEQVSQAPQPNEATSVDLQQMAGDIISQMAPPPIEAPPSPPAPPSPRGSSPHSSDTYSEEVEEGREPEPELQQDDSMDDLHLVPTNCWRLFRRGVVAPPPPPPTTFTMGELHSRRPSGFICLLRCWEPTQNDEWIWEPPST